MQKKADYERYTPFGKLLSLYRLEVGISSLRKLAELAVGDWAKANINNACLKGESLSTKLLESICVTLKECGLKNYDKKRRNLYTLQGKLVPEDVKKAENELTPSISILHALEDEL